MLDISVAYNKRCSLQIAAFVSKTFIFSFKSFFVVEIYVDNFSVQRRIVLRDRHVGIVIT